MSRTRKRTAKDKLEAMKPRNTELALILKHDPRRVQERVITPKKQKCRPRRSNRAAKELGETA